MEPTLEGQEPEIPPRRRNGCLWGCLGALGVVLLLAGGGIGYTAYTLYRELQGDSHLSVILEMVRQDGRAADVIGSDFHVMQVERLTFQLPDGRGFATTYKITVIGAGGESVVDARLENGRKDKVIVSLTVTGMDGRTVRLIPKPKGKEADSTI
jgi:hypothetical protein